MGEHGSLGLTSRGDLVAASALSTVSLAGLFVILRFFTRARMLNILGRDDMCILISLLFSVGNTIGMIVQVKSGLGQHINLLSSQQLTVFLKGAYATILLYNISLTFAKVSILFQYLRIFTTRNIARICYAEMVIVIIYGLWASLSSVFFCMPIASFWDLTIKGKCLPKGPVWFTNAGINIATDFMVVITPMPLIRRLQLSARQKIGLYMVFMVGLFICTVSILRLRSLYNASFTQDPTYDNVGVATWSSIELNTAILCACLPTLRPLIARIFPSLVASGRPRTSYYQPSNGVNAYRSGNKSFVVSTSDHAMKRGIKLDSASETAIINAPDDFSLVDIEVVNTESNKKSDIGDIEAQTFEAQSKSSSRNRQVHNEA